MEIGAAYEDVRISDAITDGDMRAQECSFRVIAIDGHGREKAQNLRRYPVVAKCGYVTKCGFHTETIPDEGSWFLLLAINPFGIGERENAIFACIDRLI